MIFPQLGISTYFGRADFGCILVGSEVGGAGVCPQPRITSTIYVSMVRRTRHILSRKGRRRVGC